MPCHGNGSANLANFLALVFSRFEIVIGMTSDKDRNRQPGDDEAGKTVVPMTNTFGTGLCD